MLMVVGGVLGVISWIGYMMATTKPSPSSIIQDEEK
jgi:predicted DNA-binding transcriptional regulator